MIRQWRRRRRFAQALAQTLRENKHTMEDKVYEQSLLACKDKKKMGVLMRQTETAPGLYGGIRDWDWDSILEWVQVHFIPLMRALLPLLVLL